MGENDYFNNLKNSNLIDVIKCKDYLNHLENYYNTIEFEKYYKQLILDNNEDNLKIIHNNNDIFYNNILDIWTNNITKNNLYLFCSICNSDFVEYIVKHNNFKDIIDKLIKVMDIETVFNNDSIFNLFFNYILLLVHNNKCEINNDVILYYLKLFNYLKNKINYNYQILLDWFHSSKNIFIKDESILNNEIEIKEVLLDKNIENDNNYMSFLIFFWCINKVLENNIINSCRFLYKYNDINDNCKLPFMNNLNFIKNSVNELLNNKFFINFILFSNNVIINNDLNYIPLYLVDNLIFVNLYLSNNGLLISNVNKFIHKLFNYDKMNVYLLTDLIYLIEYSIGNELFYEQNKIKYIKLFNKLYNLDNSNNITIDNNPNYLILEIFKKYNFDFNSNSKLYYNLFKNIFDDMEFYFNMYMEKNKYIIENNSNMLLIFDDRKRIINHIINILDFVKIIFNNNFIYDKIIYKKIINMIINIVNQKKKNEKLFHKIDKLNNKEINKNIILYLYYIFNNKYMINIFSNINKKNNILNYINYNLNDYNINIIDIYKINLELFKKKSKNIPDELLDPLTYECIEEPYYLPNNILIDKNTILTHLLDKEENPFNKVKLTIEQFMEYNNKEEIVKLRKEIEKKIFIL